MYFEQPLEKILIGNEELPVKIDMFVLEKIQGMYGNLNEFELKIKGLKLTDDKKYERVEPDIGAMNFVLPLMVREGCEIEGIELELTDMDIVRGVKCSYIELGKLITKEFDKCFESEKKEKPSKQIKKQNR